MAWSLISNTSIQAATNPTTTAINTTGADLIVVCVAWFQNTFTLSDSASNTWTGLTAQTPGQVNCQLFYKQAPTTSATHTFTATGSSIFSTLLVAAFSGSTSTPFDVQNGAQTASAQSLQTGSITPGSNNELIVSGFACHANTTYSVNSSLTITNQQPFAGSLATGGALAYFAQTTAAAINPTWSFPPSNSNASAVIASFRSSGGAASSIGILWRTFLDGIGGGGFFRGNRVQ